MRDAAAMPVKNEILQDIPVCAVVLYARADMSEQALLMYARARLGVQSPDRVVIIDEIPRNDKGKLIRDALMKHIVVNLGITS